MDNRVYWIWLQQAFGEGSPLPWKIFKGYPGGIREFYEGGPRLWNTRRDISDQKAEGLYHFTLEAAKARLDYALSLGWEVLTPESGRFPEGLRHIPDPPAALYVQGTLPDLDTRPAIALVGARKATPESKRAAERIACQLTMEGAAVVSGEATGVDFSALMGALSGGGPAVSVLPVDLGSPYLVESASLRRTIVQRGGALVSEYFTQRNPNKGTFPHRNRLITGMCCGVVIIQARLKSGTMIYARHAKEQDRDVFVVLGPEGSPGQEGCLSLLEDGAKAVANGEDVLEEYALRFRQREKDPPREPVLRQVVRRLGREESRPAVLHDSSPLPPELSSELSPEERAVLEALGGDTLPVGLLAERTGMPVGALFGLLTRLEMEDKIVSLPGKRYRRA